MDRAFWITWYDLPELGRDAYLSWLNGTYIPKVLERPGVLWAAHYASEADVVPLGGGKGRVGHVKPDAVPAGDRFILMFGGTQAHVFADPSPNQFHARLPEQDKNMLATRVGERVNIMVEEARVHGPAATQPEPDMAPSPCIQLGSFNSGSYEDEDDMLAWYAQWRLPSMKTLPGCVRVRKLVSVSGWAKHACLYEFTSLAARNSNFVHYERSNPEMEAWSKRAVRNTIHAPGSANVARRIWLAMKNADAPAAAGRS
jgi:hypothetical protein